MDGSPLTDPSGLYSVAESFLETAFVHRHAGVLLVTRRSAGEQPDRVTVEAPVGAQQGQGAWRQGDGAVLVAFAAANMQLHARAVNLGDLQPHAFEQAQATGIDHTQADAVVRASDVVDDPP